MLGAPALLALEHRGPEQLGLLTPDMLLAEGNRPVRAGDVMPQGADRLRVYVFEFTAGESFAGITPPRSSRIIVRFHDLALEHDAAFERLSPRLIGAHPGFGAGIVSGFNALGTGPALEPGLAYARRLAQSWMAAGIGVVHLEMAGYETAACRDTALDRLAGAVTLHRHELLGVPGDRTRGAGARPRHAAAGRTTGRQPRFACMPMTGRPAPTRGDPAQEREALMDGVPPGQRARAANGALIVPQVLPAEAHFETPPAEETQDGWHIVSCPSPHLHRPRTTLGLGGTFMAGCLLVLGQEKLPQTKLRHCPRERSARRRNRGSSFWLRRPP